MAITAGVNKIETINLSSNRISTRGAVHLLRRLGQWHALIGCYGRNQNGERHALSGACAVITATWYSKVAAMATAKA